MEIKHLDAKGNGEVDGGAGMKYRMAREDR